MKHGGFLVLLRRSILRVGSVLFGLGFLMALGVAYARFVEPTWLCVRYIRLSERPSVRIIHISDIHFTGDTQYLERVAARKEGSRGG